MEQFLTPQWLIIFGVAIAGFSTWYFLNHRKRGGGKAQKEIGGDTKYKPINAIIYDRTTIPFTWYEQTLDVEVVKSIVESKNIGRQLVLNGKKIFRFYKMIDVDKKVYYEGITEPTNVKNSPVAAYIDMQHPYTSILDDMRDEKNFMQKYGHLLIWLGVIAFLIVMIVTNK
jgi:hypothetical protein